MPHMQISPSVIVVNLRCYYRVPNLGRVGHEFVDCNVINYEKSHTGRITTVVLESRMTNKFYTTVPCNLYF